MIRLNRSRFLGIVCLTIFIYFLVFTDSGSSSTQFRANTEAGLARRRQREQDLPLRGHLSDEDLTKKTHDELQGILNSPSREGVKHDELGNNIGRVYREPQHDAPTRADLERQGMTREDPIRHYKTGEDEQQKPRPEAASVEAADLLQSKATSNFKDSAVRTGKEKAMKADLGDNDVESAEDPGRALVIEKLDEYLKSPGKSLLMQSVLSTPLTCSSRDILKIVLSSLPPRKAAPSRHLQDQPETCSGGA